MTNTIKLCEINGKVYAKIIDQRFLPHQLLYKELHTTSDVILAIKDMWVRGAPLIGVTAAFGMYLAVQEALQTDDAEKHVEYLASQLIETRPTAVNLKWAVEQQLKTFFQYKTEPARQILEAKNLFEKILADDIEQTYWIGVHGLALLKEIHNKNPYKPIQILTHCNAGWLACVKWGTATSPIYQAHEAGIPVHVWVDETRPRNQGANLTAWELKEAGVPCTIIVDNMGGQLMQEGKIDVCIVGADRISIKGHVANKIGTYLKALAAQDNQIPFWVAAPSSTIDFDKEENMPIEVRDDKEVHYMEGLDEQTNTVQKIKITPAGTFALNYAFDITPARLINYIITERGVCRASLEGIQEKFSDKFAQ